MAKKVKAELLGYVATECPHCQKQVFMREYRPQLGTLEDVQRHAKQALESLEKEKGEPK